MPGLHKKKSSCNDARTFELKDGDIEESEDSDGIEYDERIGRSDSKNHTLRKCNYR